MYTKPHRYTKEDINVIIDNILLKDIVDIAQMLGVTRSSLTNRLFMMRNNSFEFRDLWDKAKAEKKTRHDREMREYIAQSLKGTR